MPIKQIFVERGRENPEADSPLKMKSDAGLDARTLRAGPEPKARAGRAYPLVEMVKMFVNSQDTH